MKIVWKTKNNKTTVINEKPSRELCWRRFIITRIRDGGEPYVKSVVTYHSKDEYLESDYDKGQLLSIAEVPGSKPTQNCTACGKPFMVGDKVLKYHDLAEHTLIFIDGHLGYFGECYPSDDSLDTHEQLGYIVHSSDVSSGMISEFKKGQELWVQGMNICEGIQSKLFRVG